VSHSPGDIGYELEEDLKYLPEGSDLRKDMEALYEKLSDAQDRGDVPLKRPTTAAKNLASLDDG